MTAVIVLGLVVLALIALLAYRERANAAERARMADRIQAPEAARIAAFDAALPAAPPPSKDEWDQATPVPLDADLIPLEELT